VPRLNFLCKCMLNLCGIYVTCFWNPWETNCVNGLNQDCNFYKYAWIPNEMSESSNFNEIHFEMYLKQDVNLIIYVSNLGEINIKI
jgi:hypothetical protein